MTSEAELACIRAFRRAEVDNFFTRATERPAISLGFARARALADGILAKQQTRLALWVAAMVRLRAGERSDASDYLDALRARWPESTDTLVLSAHFELQARRAERALTPLRKVLARWPRHSEARRLLFIALLAADRFADAEALYAEGSFEPGSIYGFPHFEIKQIVMLWWREIPQLEVQPVVRLALSSGERFVARVALQALAWHDQDLDLLTETYRTRWGVELQRLTGASLEREAERLERFGYSNGVPTYCAELRDWSVVYSDERGWLLSRADKFMTVGVEPQPDFTLVSSDFACFHDRSFQTAWACPSQHPRVTLDRAILLGGSPVVWHWFTDALARLWHVGQSSWDFDAPFILNGNLQRYQAEALDLLGVPESKRILAQPGQIISCKTLMVPSAPTLEYRSAREPLFWLRDRLLSAAGAGASTGRRLFVNREVSLGRGLANSVEVTELLGKRRFTEVLCARLSVREQIRLFRGASHIVAAHGSALCNMLFAAPGCRVVELGNPACPTLYPDLAATLGLDLTQIIGFEHDDGGSFFHDKSYEVDVDALAGLVDR
jgi:hypothetical protein